MARKIDDVQYLTKAEIEQLVLGYVTALSFRNIAPYIIDQTDWALQSGGDLDGWYYADIAHGRAASAFAYVTAFMGADARIYIADGNNSVQEKQDASTVRIWFRDEPQYDIMCLVAYG